MNTPRKKCIRCKAEGSLRDFAVCGLCKSTFHLCLDQFKNNNVNNDTKKKIECAGFRYICCKCSPALDTTAAAFKNIQAQLDVLLSAITTLKTDVNDLKKQKIPAASTSQSIDNRSYCEILKESTVVLTPKETNSNCSNEALKEKVMSTIDPVNSSISGIHRVSGNRIVLKSNKAEAEVFANDVKNKLGNDFEESVPEQNVRRLKIVNVNFMESCNDDIVRSILIQNSNLISAESKFKIVKKIPKKDNIFSLIAEVDHQTHKLFIKQAKINVKWQKCNVYDAFTVLRCFNCSRLGHKSCDCKQKDPICQKCCGNHKLSECSSQISKCINCMEANNKFNFNHDTGHPSFFHECPTMLHRLKSLKSFLHYDK
jgi:hypothetical protein